MIGGPQGAAARLGLKRTTLVSKMKRLGIYRPRYQRLIGESNEDPNCRSEASLGQAATQPQLEWQMTRHLSTHVNYIFVFNASSEDKCIYATTSMSYISPWVTYRF